MRLLKLSLLFSLSLIVICSNIHGQRKKKNKKNETKEFSLETGKDSISYALGLLVASNLKSSGLTDLNYDAYMKGLDNYLSDDSLLMQPQEASQYVNEFAMAMVEKKGEENLKEAEEFLDENKKKKGVVELQSGLQYEILREGEGDPPGVNDKVTTHYKGMLKDGTVFDSSYERGEPVEFPVNAVIKGWTEALQLMKPGAKWKLYIPPTLGYGSNPPPGKIEPNSLLIFEVELLSVNRESENTGENEKNDKTN